MRLNRSLLLVAPLLAALAILVLGTLRQSGTLARQERADGRIRTIHVIDSPPESGGPCLTSITTGSKSLWLTAAAGTPNGGVCVR